MAILRFNVCILKKIKKSLKILYFYIYKRELVSFTVRHIDYDMQRNPRTNDNYELSIKLMRSGCL